MKLNIDQLRRIILEEAAKIREEMIVGPAHADDKMVSNMKLPEEDDGRDLRHILGDLVARLENLEKKS
jgi:hypothetical protein